MKRALTLFFLILFKTSFAQYNLVLNSSFELNDTCPTGGGQLYKVLYWTNPITGNSSPDYLNACGTPNWSVPNNQNGNEPAHTGVAYAALVTGINNSSFPQVNNYREYVQTELIDSLIQGVNYCIRFYVSLTDSSGYWCNNIGVYFSSTQIQYSCFSCGLPFTPQFENPIINNLNSSNGWTEISGNFIANGGEKFVVIGNFRDSTNTTLQITGVSTNIFYHTSYYYLDDILITPCDSLSGLNEIDGNFNLNVVPNPFHNQFTIKAGNEIIYQALLFSVSGSILFKELNINSRVKTIELENLPNGIYFLELITTKKKYHFKLIKN